MSYCEKCCCYDDNYVEGEDITEEELEKDPKYVPPEISAELRRSADIMGWFIPDIVEVSKKQMDKKDQLTPEEYKRVIHVITHFQLGSRVNDFKTIKAKLKRQLASLENNGWYSK